MLDRSNGPLIRIAYFRCEIYSRFMGLGRYPAALTAESQDANGR